MVSGALGYARALGTMPVPPPDTPSARSAATEPATRQQPEPGRRPVVPSSARAAHPGPARDARQEQLLAPSRRPSHGGRQPSRLGPAPGDTAGPPAVPAAAVPMPAIRLSTTRRPGHHMCDPRHDLVIASRAAVPFHRPRTRYRPHDVLVAVRTSFGPPVHIAQPGAQPMRLRPVTLAARFSSWHGFQLRRAGIRCSRSRAGRCNRA